ncbi:MAG: MFS transporter [Alphaproteobacteria bacterium]|nr:MFS transporter [Alphaproteobacteria bacterium]
MTANTPTVDDADTGSFRGDAKVIGLIGVAHFFSHFYILLLPPLFLLLKAEFDVSFVELGLFITVFSAATGVSQIPFGYIVDKLGAKWILIGGLALEGAAFLAIGVAGEYWAILLLMAIAGIANGVYHPADYAILSASVSEKRMGRAFSLHTFTGFAGFAVAPTTIIFLEGLVGWRTGVALCGVAGIVAALALVVFGRTLKHEPGSDRRKAKAAVAGKTAAEAAGGSILLNPMILMCLLFFMLLSLSSGGINNFLVSALNALYGTPIEAATLGLTGYLIGSTGGILLGGVIADRTRHHNRVAAICFLLTGIGVLIVGSFAMPVWLLVVLMTVQGLTHGIIMPSRDMIVRSVTPPGSMGKVFGFVSTGFSLGGIVAPLVFGFLLDQGEPRVVFYVIAGFMAVSLLTVFTVGGKAKNL